MIANWLDETKNIFFEIGYTVSEKDGLIFTVVYYEGAKKF
jgi:hypothetical protein